MASVYPFIPRAEREPIQGVALPVDVEDEQPQTVNGARIRKVGGGAIEVDFNQEDSRREERAERQDTGFSENLAESLEDHFLTTLAHDVLEMVEVDLESRKPWYERLAKGLETLGIVDEKDFAPPFEGACAATHPLIAEAIVQFQSRALAELVPAAGPAKGLVLGDRTDERDEQAKRVEDYINYSLMIEDKNYFPEMDQLLFLLGAEGSEFKKIYTDPLTGRSVSRLVRAEDFVVPYGATTLEEAPRYTHVITYSPNDYRRAVESGFYRDVDNLGPPTMGDATASVVTLQDAKDEAQGQNFVDIREQDRPRVIYEMHVDYVIPGESDEDEIALPYIISVERDTPCVVAIRRNWDEQDELRRKKVHFVHFPFIRGTGFYGFGFVHLIGGLGQAATGVLRLMIDNGVFAALQGGFKSKDAKLPSNVVLTPGKWIDTEMSAEELAKAFYTPPFKDVPESMYKLLGLLTEMGQRYASTTENVVGDAKNTGPVGTTVALIEQGSKVFSSIHKRLHFAQGEELRLLADLMGRNVPPDGYPYEVPGASRYVMAEDFDSRVDVVPVSDPNIFSSTQRVAIAQSTLELASQQPSLYDMRKVHLRMLQALRVPDADDLLIDRSKIQRCDPVTENALMVVGRPAKATIDQDHQAHIAVHTGLLEMMHASGTLTPQVQATVQAHVAEHYAMDFQVQMSQAMGMPPMPVNYDAEPNEPVAQQLPPQIENMVAARAAAAINKLRPPQMSPEQMREQAKIQESQAKIAQKEREMQIDARLQAQQQQFDQRMSMQEEARAAAEQRFNMQLAAEKQAREQALAEQKARFDQKLQLTRAQVEEARKGQQQQHDAALKVASAVTNDERANTQQKTDQALSVATTVADQKRADEAHIAEQERATEAHKGEQKRADEGHKAEQKRADQTVKADVERKNEATQADVKRKDTVAKAAVAAKSAPKPAEKPNPKAKAKTIKPKRKLTAAIAKLDQGLEALHESISSGREIVPDTKGRARGTRRKQRKGVLP